jgi:hypothetical protein
MSNLLATLLLEVQNEVAGKVVKTAAAPNEAPTLEAQNADVLEMSQAMIEKIDNFMQQVGMGGAGADPNQDPNQQAAAAGGDGTQVDPAMGGDPNAQVAPAAASVNIEVPAGMSVKLASCDPIDSNTALRTIIGLIPSYFGE